MGLHMRNPLTKPLRTLFTNVWFSVCLVGAALCLGLFAQLLLRLPPFESADTTGRLLLGLPAFFGGLAALHGLVAMAFSSARDARLAQLRRQVRRDQRRIAELEEARRLQRARIDELSVLREVATVISQESDFSIIAEKVLELLDGLLSPVETTIFLSRDGKRGLEPFAHYAEHKAYAGKKVPNRMIPDFDLAEFESHSMVCRVHGQELQAILPMKVEDRILGVLLLVFATDSRPKEVQRAEFNRTRRHVLMEVCRHMSLAAKAKHLHTRAAIDALTRLYSRHHFQTQVEAQIGLAARAQETFALALIDIDHFKLINDRYGHATGDMVLARLAGRLQRTLRKYDTAYRVGGEEMAALLPRTSVEQAVGVAERLRRAVERKRFRGAEGKFLRVTVSIGVAGYTRGEGPDEIYDRADKHLYRAKNEGRNRVVPSPADSVRAA
jgi:diguanylate cyclase (GGDEF)-like protein